MAADSRLVVLLRGINVGGRRPVSMQALRTLFAGALGCRDVQTYIQSGNLVCTSSGADLSSARVKATLEEHFGFPVPVITRTAGQWRALVAANPFIAEGADPAYLHAVFFSAPPSPDTSERLRTLTSGGEQLIVFGGELYLHLPHGVGRSKLALSVVAPKTPGTPTMRNWRTVVSLANLL